MIGDTGTFYLPRSKDVFRSYSWSANVCGAKLWLFLPPPQKHLVFDRYMKNCVYNVFEDVSEVKFPEFKKAVWLECTQGANEIIFVPSGWYHQVHNLEDTISINHNWFNAYNLSWVWDLLLMDYNEAKEYIEDIRDICDDFEALCQWNLAANTGMNFNDFFTFLVHMSVANVVQLLNLLRSPHPSKAFPSSTCSWVQHIVFSHGFNYLMVLLSLDLAAGGMKVKAGIDESSPYAAMLAAQDVSQRCKELGITTLHIKLQFDGSQNQTEIQF